MPTNPCLEGLHKPICNSGCGARGAIAGAGFRITIFDERSRGDNSKPRLERVVVGGTPHRLMLASHTDQTSRYRLRMPPTNDPCARPHILAALREDLVAEHCCLARHLGARRQPRVSGLLPKGHGLRACHSASPLPRLARSIASALVRASPSP
jgi:hypothetical protein